VRSLRSSRPPSPRRPADGLTAASNRARSGA